MEKITGLFGTIWTAFKKLTKREQVMIYGLVIIVVLAILIFLILMPAMTYISDLNNEVSELEVQETEMRLAIASVSTNEEVFKDSQEKFNAFKKLLYTEMDPESLDELVTSFLVESGLTPKDLKMTVLQQTQVPAFAPGDLKAAGAPNVGSDGAITSSDESTDDEASGGGSGITAYLYTISISVEGDKSDLATLTDRIKTTNGIELRNFSLASGDGDIVEGITTKGTINAVLSIYVYVDSDKGSALPALDTSEFEEESKTSE